MNTSFQSRLQISFQPASKLHSTQATKIQKDQELLNQYNSSYIINLLI